MGPSSRSQQEFFEACENAAAVVQGDGGPLAHFARGRDMGTEDGGLFGPDDYIMVSSFSEADRHEPMTDVGEEEEEVEEEEPFEALEDAESEDAEMFGINEEEE